MRIGSSLVSWISKKQNCVVLSTAEAEYITTAATAQEICWLRLLLKELKIEQGSTTLYEDNISCITIAKNPVKHTVRIVRIYFMMIKLSLLSFLSSFIMLN